MTYAASPARAVRRLGGPVLSSSALFRWQCSRLSLTALTGQVGVLTRASTATAVDGLGTTWTAPHSLPRWESRDWNGDGVREALGLRLTTDDLAWPILFGPMQGTWFIEAAEVSTRTGADGLLYVGNDAQSGARLSVQGDGTYYASTLTNGTDTETVTLTAEAPDTDQVFRAGVQIQVSEDGTEMRHRLLLDVLRTEGEHVSAWSAWQTKPAAWGSTAKVRVNRLGSAGAQGSTWVRDVAFFPEIRTLEQCAWL